jgi:hypothetical protein
MFLLFWQFVGLIIGLLIASLVFYVLSIPFTICLKLAPNPKRREIAPPPRHRER